MDPNFLPYDIRQGQKILKRRLTTIICVLFVCNFFLHFKRGYCSLKSHYSLKICYCTTKPLLREVRTGSIKKYCSKMFTLRSHY